MCRWKQVKERLFTAIKNFKLQPSPLYLHYISWDWLLKNIENYNPDYFEDINWILNTKKFGYPIGIFKKPGDVFNTATWDDDFFGIRSKVAVAEALIKRVEDGTCKPVGEKPSAIIPLLAVPKPGYDSSGFPKMRLVRHGGYGKNGIATNDRIPEFWFKKKLPSGKYIMFIIWRIGRFGTMIKLDIANAFRNMAYTNDGCKYRGYYFLNQYFIDTRVIFGGREGPIYCQELNEDIICIYFWYMDVESFKLYLDVYIDDYYGGSCYTIGSHYLKHSLMILLDILGVPINQKLFGPARVIEICGIIYNIYEHDYDFSFKKSNIMLYYCLLFLSTGSGWSKDIESLKSRLRWGAVMRWPGVAFLRRIQQFINEIKRIYGDTNVFVIFPCWALKDLVWWILFLLLPKKTSIKQALFEPDIFIEFYSDAATGDNKKVKVPGLGVYFNVYWFSIAVPQNFLGNYKKIERNYSKEMNIAHFEILAIMCGWFTFLPIIKNLPQNTVVRFRCDNDIVNYAIAKKNSDDEFINDCIRLLCFSSAQENIRFFGLSLRSEFNKMADLLSRFKIMEFLHFCNINGYVVHERTWNVIFPDIWSSIL